MTKTMSNTGGSGLELGRWLVYGAAAFQAYHMGRAFHVYDPDGWHVMGVNVGGLILGAILNVIVARTATQLPNISATFASLKALMPKPAKKLDKKNEQARSRALKRMTLAAKQNAYSQVGYYILLVFSTLMVAPALYILWSKTLPFHPLFIGFMAAVGAVAPDVAITVGGFAGSDTPATLSERGTTLSVSERNASERGATLKPRSAIKPAKISDGGSDKPAKIYRCVCGNMTTTNRYEYSGHARTCEKFKAFKAAEGAIPVDLSAMPSNVERGER